MAGEKIKIQLLAESGTLSELTALCAPLGIEHCTESPLALAQTKTHLALRKLDEPKLGDVFVDFVAGTMAHRRKFGGGRGEAIAKAVGIIKCVKIQCILRIPQRIKFLYDFPRHLTIFR